MSYNAILKDGKIDLNNPLAIKLLKDTFREDPIAFGKFFFPDSFKAATPRFHKEIANLFKRGINKLADKDFKDIIRNALIVPRGHAKTSIGVTLFYLWAIVHNKFKYGLMITNTSTLAQDNLAAIASELKTNSLLKLFYYPNNNIDSGVWNKEEIECFVPDKDGTMQTCCVKAFGSGKEVRGTKYYMHRPDVIICDDLESSEQCNSKEQRAKMKKWFEGDLIPCFGNKGYFCIVGTILHYDSLLNNIKDNVSGAYADYNIIEYKAINLDENGNEVALWEDNKPLKWLLAEKERLSLAGELSSFYREYMNTPISDEERVFKDEVIENNRYDKTDLLIKWRKGEVKLNISMGVDTAISQKTSADFSAVVVIGTDPNGVTYVLEAWHDRCLPVVLADKVFEFYKVYRPSSVAMQRAGIDQLYKANFEDRMRRERIFFTIRAALYASPTGSNKEDRIRGSLANVLNTNSLKIDRSMLDLVNEFIQFPYSKHDDLLDALQIAFMYSIKPKERELDIKTMNRMYEESYFRDF